MKKMEIISSVYGTIIYGKVIGLKPGTGNAASRLTIVTLNEINENGQIVGGHYIKVLFWNSKNGKQNLSDRARKLKSGDLISCRVIFDAGIHSKAVGFEFKRSGLYTLAMKDEQKTYILHGHAEKVIHGKNGYCGIYVPIKRYQNGSFQTVWYLASFFNSNISVGAELSDAIISILYFCLSNSSATIEYTSGSVILVVFNISFPPQI